MICCTPPPIRHAVQYGFKNLRAQIALICTSVKYRRRGWIRGELVVAAGDAADIAERQVVWLSVSISR